MPAPQLLRCEAGRALRRQRNVYERREKGRVFGRVETDQPQRVFEVCKSLFGRSIIHTKALPAPFGNRMKRGVLQKLRSAPLAPGVRRLSQMRTELVQEPRLAEPRFAHDEHELAFAGPDAVPSARQQSQFLLAANERR